MTKYAGLARKHHRPVEDAATAAFIARRGKATRRADDPWAVVTRAVQITLGAEEHAETLLCSVDQARRPSHKHLPGVVRFPPTGPALSDWHPAFHTHDPLDDNHNPAAGSIGTGGDSGTTGQEISAGEAMARTGELFLHLGWDGSMVAGALAYVESRLIQTGSRTAAAEAARRDAAVRAVLDIPARSWNVLIRIVLGSTDPARARTHAGRGVLVRLLCGTSVDELAADPQVVGPISGAVPQIKHLQ
jgi:hypothetical protein